MAATAGMKWASALCLTDRSETALAEALASVKTQLGGARPDAVFVFISPHHKKSYDQIGELIEQEFKARHTLGCSGGGVIGAGKEAEQVAALSVTAAVLPNVDIHPLRFVDGKLPDLDAGPRVWEEATGVKASTNPHFILLADPFTIHADELLAGLDFAYPNAAKVGGLASGATGAGQNIL